MYCSRKLTKRSITYFVQCLMRSQVRGPRSLDPDPQVRRRLSNNREVVPGKNIAQVTHQLQTQKSTETIVNFCCNPPEPLQCDKKNQEVSYLPLGRTRSF